MKPPAQLLAEAIPKDFYDSTFRLSSRAKLSKYNANKLVDVVADLFSDARY